MAAPVLVIYDSGSGNTSRMAEAVADGIRAGGREVLVKKAEAVEVSDLQEAPAFAIGSPTYFSNVCWSVKKVIDESIALYGEGGGYALRGRPCAVFTSSGSERDARDCLRMLELAFGLHHQMEVLPGVIRVNGQAEEEVTQRCRDLGESLTGKLRA
jgi:multimeric flavodoxin WrbA